MNRRQLAVVLVTLAFIVMALCWWQLRDASDRQVVADAPVASTEEAAAVAPVAEPVAVLHGRVWNQAGMAVVGATVRLGSKRVLSGDAGVFALPHPGAGVHEVSVTAPGLVFGRGTGCCEPIALREPAKTRLLTLTVHQPGAISGTVVAAGRPVAGATFTVHYRLARGLTRSIPRVMVPSKVTTDDDGRFQLDGLAAGRLRVEAAGSGRKALGEVVDLQPAGQIAQYIIDIKAVAALTGRVQSRDGAHVQGAYVEVGDADSIWRAKCDVTGHFRLQDIPPGTWQIRAVAEGFEPSVERGVAFYPHGALSRSISLSPIIGVAGKVIDASGEAVVGATVVVKHGVETDWVRTQTDGRFRYGQVADDVRDAVLIAVHPEHAPSDARRAQPGKQMVLQMGKGGRIDGLVATPDGSPPQSANVAIIKRVVPTPDPHGEPMGREVVVKVDGTFSLGPLRPGVYDLLGRSTGKSPGVLRNVQVKGGEAVEVIVNLDAGATLGGAVTSSGGVSAAGAVITVFARAGNEELTRAVRAGDDGNFVVEKLPPGPARVRVELAGHLPQVTELEMPERGEKRHDVSLRQVGQGVGVEATVGRIGAVLVETERGVVLQGLVDDGVAAKAGIANGEVLASIDFQPSKTRSIKELAESLNNAPPTQITLEVIDVDGRKRSVYLDM